MIEEKKVVNEFEKVYQVISEFKKNKYREQVGLAYFSDFEIDLNRLIILFLENSVKTDAINKKAAEFYIFEIGLENAVLIEQRRKFLEAPLVERQGFSPKFDSIIKNGVVRRSP